MSSTICFNLVIIFPEAEKVKTFRRADFYAQKLSELRQYISGSMLTEKCANLHLAARKSVTNNFSYQHSFLLIVFHLINKLILLIRLQTKQIGIKKAIC